MHQIELYRLLNTIYKMKKPEKKIYTTLKEGTLKHVGGGIFTFTEDD